MADDKTTPSVCILSLSNVAHDGRVLRLTNSFTHHGWRVELISLQGNYPTQDITGFHPIPLNPDQLWQDPVSSFVWTGKSPSASTAPRGLRALRYGQLALAKLQPKAVIARFGRWGRFVLPIKNIIDRLAPCQLILAVDWNMLHLATYAKEKWDATLIYDSHEYAREEFSENKDWFWFERPSRMVIENAYVQNADLVLSVSDSISMALQQIYRLQERPQTVRNVPIEPARKSSSDSMSRFLYVGRIGPGRKLVDLVTSLPNWREDQDLTLIGPGHDGSTAQHLNQLASRLGVAGKLSICPPVAPDAIVQMASQYDVGVILLSGRTKQNQWCLPNKLFEYLAAGLAILTTDLPEIRKVLAASQIGVFIKTSQPSALASTIHGMSKSKVCKMKKNAVLLGKSRSWEQEITPLFAHPSVRKYMVNRANQKDQ